VTARWVVDEVTPNRDLRVTWQPISLLLKNDVQPDAAGYEAVLATHKMLRVMEAIRVELGESVVAEWYFNAGTLIHHDRNRYFDIAEALGEMGLDAALAAAADDEKWDVEIRRRMDEGLALAGDDIGTPIIALRDRNGDKQGYFGPVITRVPPTADSLAMWDALVAMMNVNGFWELKRTRTDDPEFGDRPNL
jgi:hypothetical protein